MKQDCSNQRHFSEDWEALVEIFSLLVRSEEGVQFGGKEAFGLVV